MRLTGPKLGLNLLTMGAVHVTLYCMWRPSVLLTGPQGQVSPVLHTPYISLPNTCLLFATHAHTSLSFLLGQMDV